MDDQEKIVGMPPENVEVSFDLVALYVRKGFAALGSIDERTFVLMPNAGELELLTGAADYRKGAEAMLKKVVKVVAVKLGSKGCYVTDGKQSRRVEAFKVKWWIRLGLATLFARDFFTA